MLLYYFLKQSISNITTRSELQSQEVSIVHILMRTQTPSHHVAGLTGIFRAEKKKIKILNFSLNYVKYYCTQLLHGITCPFSKYFQILYIFAQIFKYFALFQHLFTFFLKNCTHDLTF